MLALTHSHLALGDYKFQHPPLATRPRPLLKAGLGTSRRRDKWPSVSLASWHRGQPGLDSATHSISMQRG